MENTVIYEVRDYVLDANGETEDFIPAAFVRVLEATGALAVAFGSTDGFQRIEAGLGVETVQPFQKVRFRDLSGAANAVRVAYAGSRVADSRLTITGGNLGVKDPGIGAESFSDVVAGLQAVIAALREDQQLRAPLTTLAGAAYYSANNTTTAVVTGAANTNGAIIRLVGAQQEGGSHRAHLVIGAAYFTLDWLGTSSQHFRDIFVPAGTAISLVSSGTSATVHAFVEVL